MSTAKPTHRDGRRKMSDEHRAKLSERSSAQWAAMTPEARAAALARIGRKPKAAAKPDPPAGPVPGPAGGSSESRNPLAMTPLELLRRVRGHG